jgi:S1-C subfamily serine protease
MKRGSCPHWAPLVAFTGTIALLAAGCGGDKANSRTTLAKIPTQAQLIAKVKPSVIQVYGKSFDSVYGGTAVIIDKERHLAITNAHVTVGLAGMKARSGDFETPAKLVATAPCDDVSVIRLTSLPSNATEIEFGSAANLKAGQKVTALGYPGSFENPERQKLNSTVGTVSVDGTVRATPDDGLPTYPSVIQHQAPIGHGSSGGPLVDTRGRLLGINTLANDPDQTANQAYAISVEHINDILPSLKRGKSVAYVGWELTPAKDLDNSDMKDLGWKVDPEGEGMLILSVDTASPADRRHFAFGDYIEQIEHTKLVTMTDVCDVLQSKRGEVIQVDGRWMSGDDANETWTEKVRVR